MNVSLKKNLFLLPYLVITLSHGQIQWASKALEVSSEKNSRQCSGGQALGKPSVMPQGGRSYSAWEPALRTKKEFIKVGFKKPVRIQQVIICENYLPGSISRVYAIDKHGKEHLLKKVKPLHDPEVKTRVLSLVLPLTQYEVTSLRVVCDMTRKAEVSQIDAIGISETTQPFTASVNHTVIETEAPIENLGEGVNTQHKELAPVITPDGKTLFFTRESPENIGGGKQDIWYADINTTSGKFGKAVNLGPPINNERNNYASSITPDGNSLLIGNIYYEDGTSSGNGLSLSVRQGNGWTFPKKITIKNYLNRGNYTSAYLANDGKTLLLGIIRDDTHGGEDIYVCFLQPNGSWSQPLNLGAKINTASDEYTPFLAADGVTLYFTSEGMPGYGSGDIYLSKRLDNTWQNWSEPLNMGPSFNTHLSDYYFTIPASGEYAYLVSGANTLGATDIFRIQLPLPLRPQPVVLVNGRVFNAKTKQPIGATIRYELLPAGEDVGKANAQPVSGEYKIVLPAGNAYGFRAEAEGYVAIEEHLDVKDVSEYKEIQKDLYLVPVEVGQTVLLNNIFFETKKAELAPASLPELRRTIEFLKENPSVEIEISGHTDDVGDEADNMALSAERARSVSNYLVQNGIKPSRLTAKGYGETKPKNSNASEESRQLNRRVEFIIRKK